MRLLIIGFIAASFAWGQTGASQTSYRLPATGATLSNVQAELQQHYELKADFGAKGDGTTNDTAALTAALVASSVTGIAVHAAAGTYRICAVAPTLTTGSNVALYGDGMKATMFTTHSSCLGQSANMLSIQTTGSVYLHDFGIDSLNTTGTPFNGANIGVSGNSGFTAPPASLTVENLYVAHGQVVGLQCQPCQNVLLRGNTFYQNWWVGASFASSDSNNSPVYNYNFVSSGNLFEHTPIGLEFSFFLTNISESADTYQNSSLYLTTLLHANYAGSGLSFNGAADYGCLSAQCGTTGQAAAIYAEGTSDVDISGSIIEGFNTNAVTTGVTASFVALGSKLQIPVTNPTYTDFPINNFHIHGLTIHNGNNANTLVLSGLSNGPSPTLGSGDSVKSNVVESSFSCPIVTGVTSFEVEGNTCDNIQTNGYNLNFAQKGSFRNNRGHNIGLASSGAYYGLLINGSGSSKSQNIDAFGNEMTNDTGVTMSSCYSDATLAGGDASQVRHFNNKCHNGGQWTPTPAIPSLGTWSFGDLIENSNITAANSVPSGWVNTTAGTPGTWTPLGITVYNGLALFSGSAPTLSSCGTTPSLDALANNNSGTITTGTGSPTGCTLTFASPHFSLAPSCVVSTSPTVANVEVSTNASEMVLSFAAFSSGAIYYQCR